MEVVRCGRVESERFVRIGLGLDVIGYGILGKIVLFF